MLRRALWTVCLVALGLPACDGGGGRLDPIPREVAERACAGLGACLGARGLGQCVELLSQLHLLETADLSAMIAFNDDEDWIAHLALVENAGCAASATTCEGVLACLHGGQAQRACSPPATFVNERWCLDGDVLLDCSGVGLGSDRVQTRVSCRRLGLECIELSLGNLQAGLCANGTSSQAGANLQVTCQGPIAIIEGYGARLRMDCSLLGGICQAGTYQDLERAECCVPAGPDCDPQSFQDRCEGTRVVTCEDGRQASRDCARLEQTCGLVQGVGQPSPTCVYGSCSPSFYAESCVPATGTITYCGPAGVSTLDCKALGFSACLVLGSEARCVD